MFNSLKKWINETSREKGLYRFFALTSIVMLGVAILLLILTDFLESWRYQAIIIGFLAGAAHFWGVCYGLRLAGKGKEISEIKHPIGFRIDSTEEPVVCCKHKPKNRK